MKKLVLAAALALPMMANAAPYYGTGFEVNGNGVAVSSHIDTVVAFASNKVWFHIVSINTEDRCKDKDTIKFSYKQNSKLISVVGSWNDVTDLCYIEPKTQKGYEFIASSFSNEIGKSASVVFIDGRGVSLRGFDAAIKELQNLGEPL